MYNFKILFYLFSIYVASITLGTIIFLLLLWSPLFQDLNALFFRVGILLLITGALLFSFLTLMKIKLMNSAKYLIWRDLFLVTLIFFFINWNIYGFIPFNVARSNSVIILNYLYKNQGIPKSKKEIMNLTKQKYFDEYDAVGVRLSEQIVAGNIILTDGNYLITKKGIFVSKLFKKITNFYNEKNNYLEAVEN